MHEHLLSDARGLASDQDYVLDSQETATAELRLAAAAGLRAVVDPTGWGFGGPAPQLAEIASVSGVQIIAGVGVYLGRTRPDWIRELTEGGLTDLFLHALNDHIPGCEFRAGVVGVIAPDHPREPADDSILRAAARAAAESGRALIVRLDPRYEDGPDTVDVIAAAGLSPARVVLSNIDGYAREPRILRALAATGATLKWCFGYEAPPRAGLRLATDTQRADALLALWRDGFHAQVLACGVWTRAALRANGGFGYGHLLDRVVPALHARGVTTSEVRHLLVEQPSGLLDQDHG